MDRKHVFFAMAAIVLMVFELNTVGFAQASTAGSTLLGTVTSVITGNIGTLIGLCITILGLWTWIIKQDTAAGITMIIGGVALTVAPGIFNGAKGLVNNVVTQFSGGNNTTAVVGSSGGAQ